VEEFVLLRIWKSQYRYSMLKGPRLSYELRTNEDLIAEINHFSESSGPYRPLSTTKRHKWSTSMLSLKRT